MANQVPIRAKLDGSNNVIGLAEYQSGDTVAIAYGGTGQTTAQAAIDALLPDQSSSNGYFLTTDGTNASWGTVTTSLTLAADSGSNDTFNTGETLTFAGGTGLSSVVSDNTITFNIDNSGVSADTYGSTTAIPVLTINAQGQITSASTASISSSLDIAGDSGTDTVTVGTNTLTFVGGTGIDTAVTDNTVTINNVASGYVNSTTLDFPTGDYGSGEDFLGESVTTDSFGVSVVATFSCMDPLGSLPTATDLGVLT